MKVTLVSTTKIVQISPSGLECRVWEGVTERGIKVQALIPRIAVIAAHKDSDMSEFEAELKEQHAPHSEFTAFPLRMIL